MNKTKRCTFRTFGALLLVFVAAAGLNSCLPGGSLVGSAEIRVFVDGEEIEFAGTFNFGEVASEIDSQSITFVVKNTGVTDLVLYRRA